MSSLVHLLFAYGLMGAAGLLFIAGIGLLRRTRHWSTRIFAAASGVTFLCALGLFAIVQIFPNYWQSSAAGTSGPMYFAWFGDLSRIEILGFLIAGLALIAFAFRKSDPNIT